MPIFSYQSKMLKRIHDGLFLLRRANRHLAINGTGIVILPIFDSCFILNLSDIKICYIKPVLFLDISFDFRICCNT